MIHSRLWASMRQRCSESPSWLLIHVLILFLFQSLHHLQYIFGATYTPFKDNVRPLTSHYTKENLKDLDGIELLLHPACSPDLAPSNYHLFWSMAHFLHRKTYNNLNEVKNGICTFFYSILNVVSKRNSTAGFEMATNHRALWFLSSHTNDVKHE